MATVLQIYGNNDKGWDTYKNIMANMVLWNSSGAVPRFVNDGEAAVGITLEDAALRYKLGGGPVEIVTPLMGPPWFLTQWPWLPTGQTLVPAKNFWIT